MIKIIKNNIKLFIVSFFAGSIVLLLISISIKIYLGYKIIPPSFIIPITYGGFTASFAYYLHKKNEEQIKNQNQRLKNIIEGANVGTWERNVQTGETIFNEKWAEMIGYTLEEISPITIKTWGKYAHSQDLKKSEKLLEKHFNGEIDQYKMEIRMKHKEGHWIWIEDKGKVITWTKDGKPEWVYGTHLNITERVEHKQWLKEERDMFAQGPTIIFKWKNVEGWPVEYVSGNVKEKFGYTAKQLIMGEILYSNLIYPEDIDRVVSEVIKHNNAIDKQFNHEPYRIFTSEGKIKWVKDYTKIIRIDGKITHYLGYLIDITELKKVEKQLKQQKVQFQQLFDSSTEGIVLLDNNYQVIRINKKFESLFGYKESEIKNKNLPDYILPDNSIKEGKAYSEQVKQGKKIESEDLRKTKNGKKINVHLQGFPIELENGQIGIYALYRDITKRKKAEKQLQYKTFHDELTGLYNRAYFNEELKRYNNKRQLPLSIIMADVNGLKLTNDTFGHKAGDKLLKRIAQIIENSCRQEDLVARIAGDEFIVLLPKTSKKEAEKIYARIKEICQKSEEGPIKPSIALGIATKKEKIEDFEKVLKKAEDKMYQNKVYESKSVHNTIIDSLEIMLRETTNETLEHSQRLEDLAVALGKKMNLSGHELDVLASLANLHDLGKITISKDILQKPGPLTDKEWEEIKRHPEAGYKIANSSPKLKDIAEGILSHHERWDGKGYPQGITGEEIPLLARIITIVDSYDVMTNSRPYKEAMSKKDALEEIKKCSGSQFDPNLSKEFITMMNE